MTVVVTHTTPADSTFSSTGAAAWNADHALSGVGTMAEQNANNVAITGGTINNTTVGATTPSTGVFTTLTATGQTSLGGVAGAEGLRVLNTTSSVNYLQAKGSVSGVSAQFSAQGADSNVSLSLSSQGAGTIRFFSNSVGQEQFRVAHTNSAVNYVQVTGAATGASPTISVQGSDSNPNITLQGKGTGNVVLMDGGGNTGLRLLRAATSGDTFVDVQRLVGGVSFAAASSVTNGALVFQSKGTGAIDLAAGSSGVNISNGGTVTAITRTATGSSYTTIPSVAISAPTTASGVQATVSIASMTANTGATVSSGGTGYTIGDVLSVVGGTTATVPLTITVTAVSGGVITTASTNNAAYSVLPTNPVSVTGGTGTGATFNLTWIVSTFTITAAGSGYVEQPTVTFSGGGGSGAAAYAVVGGGAVIRSIGVNTAVVTNQAITFETAGSSSSRPAFVIRDIGTGDSWYQMGGGSTQTFLIAKGNANANAYLGASGSGSVRFTTNGDSIAEQARVSHTASAVNYVQVTGAATGNRPVISAQGSDTNLGLNIQTKGTGAFFFATGGSGSAQFVVSNTSSSVNYVQVTGATTGNAVVISAQGSDTNIPLVLQPKGTGALQAQQTDSTATGGNARGANAVDWQTTRSAASQVASGAQSVIGGGQQNTSALQYSSILGGYSNSVTSAGFYASIVGGLSNQATNQVAFIGGGGSNQATQQYATIVGGNSNLATGWYNFIGAGSANSGTANAAVTTQSGTMNATTAVTLSGSNASIKVGQYITGTSIAGQTYVAAISGTSLTLSQAASGSSTSTLSFFTPHGVVVGGGNNQATGSYSFIGGGGDAGTAANRNVASGDWSVVGGGKGNTASGVGAVVFGGGLGATGDVRPNTASGNVAVVVGGYQNIASGAGSGVLSGIYNQATANYSTVLGATDGITRGIIGNLVFGVGDTSVNYGQAQSSTLVLRVNTTDATPSVMVSTGVAGGTTNQVILPNNSAYTFRGEVVSGVTGGGNSKSWTIEGLIKRGANAASTTLVGSTVTSMFADVGAATWTIALSADTTNGGLAITFTGQAATTIRTVCQIRTTEMTY